MAGETKERFRRVLRRLSVGVLLLVPVTAVFGLGVGTLSALRGQSVLAGPVLDQRAFAPLTATTPTPVARSSAKDEVMEVRLSAWENTFATFSPPH